MDMGDIEGIEDTQDMGDTEDIEYIADHTLDHASAYGIKILEHLRFVLLLKWIAKNVLINCWSQLNQLTESFDLRRVKQ